MFMSIFLIIQLVIFNFITRTGADRLPTGNVACGIRNLGRFCLWNHCGIRLSVLCFRFSLSLVPRSTKGLVESGHPGLWKVVSLFKLFFLGGGGRFLGPIQTRSLVLRFQDAFKYFAQPVRGPQFKVRSPLKVMVYLTLRSTNQYGTCSGLPNKRSGTWRIVADFSS